MSEKQFLIVGVTLVAVIVVVFLGLTYREYAEVQEIQAKIKTLDEQIVEHQKKIEKIPGLQQEIASLGAQFEDQKDILPAAKELEKFVVVVGEICRVAGVSQPTKLIKVEARGARATAKAPGGIDEILYDCEFKGPFHAFVKFVNHLEHYKRLVRLRSFKINGGGQKDDVALGWVDLTFSLQLATYKYIEAVEAQSAAGVDDPLRLDPIEIPKEEQLDFIMEKPDPFRFNLSPITPDGPVVEEDPTKTRVDPAELLKMLAEKIDKAQELQARVFRLINNPSASPEELRKAREDYDALVKFTAKPAGAEATEKYATFQRIMTGIGQHMQKIVTRLFVLSAQKVRDQVVALTEAQRYAEVVAPFLGFVKEFKDYERDATMDKSLLEIGLKVSEALDLHVTENNKYEEVMVLVDAVRKDLGPLSGKPTGGKIYKEILEKLAEVRLKAENIKRFKDMNIQLKGLIWQPVAADRVCVVVPPKGQPGPAPRRILREGDVVGVSKTDEDRVTIAEITQFKQVIFGFRGLRIPLELGEKKKGSARGR